MSMGMNERHLKMEDNMGAFSKLFRYRERGQEANADNVEEFGTPAHSLFISTKFWSFTQKTEITDENGKVAYRAKSRAISLHDKTWITDAQNNNVAEIDRKVLTLKEYHRVKMADGNSFDIAHDFFQLYKDTARIPELGWQIRGNILSLNFQIYDEKDEVVAVVGKKLISIKDKYCIDIYRPEMEAEVVAILVALQHTLRDRAGSGSSSSIAFDILRRI